jgi:hypothetical protein
MNFIKTKFTNPAQLIGFAIQILTTNSQFIPPKYVPHVVSGIAAAQTVLAILQAYKNPNGTPAAVAYQPEFKK